MPLTRTQARDWLKTNMAETFAAAGIDTTDDANLDRVVDQALLWRGVSFDDLATSEVDAADVPAFFLVLRYVALRRIYDAILHHVDAQISDPSVSKNRSQFVRQMENSLKSALEEAEPYIVEAAGAVSAFQAGVIAWGEVPCLDEFAAGCAPALWL